MEAAPTDLLVDIGDYTTGWGCQGTEILGGVSINNRVVGRGEQNTIEIEAVCTTEGTAADLCANLLCGPLSYLYDDWFLPSIDELRLMYTNLKLFSVGGFESDNYLSSSEDDLDFSWFCSFSGGSKYLHYKDVPARVRAARDF